MELARLTIITAYGPVVIDWIFGPNLEVQDPSSLTGLMVLVGLAWSPDKSDWSFNSSSCLCLVVSCRN